MADELWPGLGLLHGFHSNRRFVVNEHIGQKSLADFLLRDKFPKLVSLDDRPINQGLIVQPDASGVRPGVLLEMTPGSKAKDPPAIFPTFVGSASSIQGTPARCNMHLTRIVQWEKPVHEISGSHRTKSP
ncbi:hypothetical protein AJ78_02626 [Emergomyces pasteurianus Ep9510]|uniref:Uncharacterized protein n=1 Tax=Emergomyces pasteurianus Ep9510 TaxID=1447872 RepID=A0A1J9QN01_9EURO|nr:hypothetical protein AJ78_02626 [Emergomyces pasteurianus Ep9510]